MEIEYFMLSVEYLIPNINYLSYIIINHLIDRKSLKAFGGGPKTVLRIQLRHVTHSEMV